MNSHDYDDSRVPEFLWLHALKVRRFLALAANRGTVSPGARPRCTGTDPLPTSHLGAAMFKIVLRPEEAALLSALRDGTCPADEVPGSMLFSLMALRMLKYDEHGNPTLTDLAEAALERMSGKLH